MADEKEEGGKEEGSTPKSWYSGITETLLAMTRVKRGQDAPVSERTSPFRIAEPPPGVIPVERKTHSLAMDENVKAAVKYAEDEFNAPTISGVNYINTAIGQGYTFLGYTYLAELTQIPEYRRISEVISTEMTRKWIRFFSVSKEDSQEKKIQELTAEIKRLNAQGNFQTLALQDGFFGRSHLFIDLGVSNDRDELIMPIGDGWDDVSKAKVKKGSLKRLKVIEAVWCYPSRYNSSDPLQPDWYNPTTWFCMGKELHATRLIRFVAREVPDLLKPAYSFGGMSLSQMAKPYIDNWLRTRQSVSNLIYNFSVMVLKTNLQDSLSAAGDLLFKRIQLFNNLRNNNGVMAVNSAPNTNDDEDLKNVAVPLTTLDILQAQSQEHMCTVSGIPKVKLLGLDPAGLNASSDSEIEVFDDTIGANQARLFRDPIRTVVGFAMLNIWGETDPDIDFVFEPLRSLNPKEEAEKRKTDAETDTAYVNAGVLSTEEIRTRIAAEPDTKYPGLDVSDVPEPPEEENPNLGGNEGDDDK